MSSVHARQKQAEKHKRKRKEAMQRRTHDATPSLATPAALVRLAEQCPHGPSFVSTDFNETEGHALVTVVVTRKLPDGTLLPSMALVDRTCLGVKKAFAGKPVPEAGLGVFVADLGRLTLHGLVACELIVAQSIVFHALDYAASLGFKPDPDFPEKLFGPRPETLADTPLSRPSKPFFVQGPDDDVEKIIATLDRTVGRGGYEFVLASGPL